MKNKGDQPVSKPNGEQTEKPGNPADYRSVQKALQILLAFTPHNQAMGTMEVSQLLGLHKSTVSRLLNVLTHYHFLRQDPRTRKFNLGRSAAQIGTAIRRSLREHLVAITQPYIDELRNRAGETVALEVWTGMDTILGYRAEAFHMRREFLLRVGDRVDVHVSAGAWAIMAFMPKQLVDTVLSDRTFPAYTEQTVVTADEIIDRFPEIREKGFAHSSKQRHRDSEIFSAPIFDHEKKPVAAVTMLVTTERLDSIHHSNKLELLKQTAAAISERLLYSEE